MMNQHDWEDATQALKRHMDPHYQTVLKSSRENSSRTNNDWDPFPQYSTYAGDEPQSSIEVSKRLEGLSRPTTNFYREESEVEDPDGEPLEMEEEDPELKRKRRELREIEERIMHKKAAIALKTVGFVKETSPPGFSCNEQSVTHKEPCLKDRVNAILHQHPFSFLSKPLQDRMNSSSLSKQAFLQRDHPLKLRVKALVRQRCRDPCVYANEEVSDVTPPPPRRSVTSPAKEENGVNQGFQRFLNVLNKGVDMDLLSRIVNDDSEDLPFGEDLLNIQASAVENKQDPPLRSISQISNGGDSLLGLGQTNNGERKTEPPSQERSLIDHLPVNVEKRNDRRDLCFGSDSPSQSPPAEVKRRREEDEEKPKVDEQRVQLQNVLKSLGLSLEVEEMSKLADRTQERLYGKKHEGVRADGRGEGDSRRSDSHRQYSFSSSSSSSSSSSRSISRSRSPSPSRSQCSHTGNSKQRRLSEHNDSRDRFKETLLHKDNNWNNKETERRRDRDQKDSKETSISQHPYPYLQNQTYLRSHSAAFSVFPDSSSSQYSHYNANANSGSYSSAEYSYWTYTQGASPLSLYTREQPCQQNSNTPNYQHFPGSAVTPNMAHRRCRTVEDINLCVNPDLSKSEGQVGSLSGPRCLQVITTKPTTQSSIIQITERLSRRENHQTLGKKRQLCEIQKAAEKQSADSVAKMMTPQKDVDESHPKAEQSEKEIQQPTEEEIKANLRKTLEAFNQKVKQKLTQPATSLMSPTG